MRNSNFSPIVTLLTNFTGTITIEAKHFVSLDNFSDKEALKSALLSANYLDDLQYSDDKSLFSLRANKWETLPPIYRNENDFWTTNEDTDTIPELYYVVSSKISSQDKCKGRLLDAIELTFKTKIILKQICDHYIASDKRALFFVNSEKGGVKKSVLMSLDYCDIQELTPKPKDLNSIDEIYKIINYDDVHTSERVEVLRRTITTLLDERHSENSDFIWVLKNAYNLHSKYKDQYEIYVHNFSTSKLLNEVDQKSLEFNSKIMDFVTNSQNKALTIPGAIIAIAALVKSNGSWTILLITAGVWVTTKMVIMSNKIMYETFEDLEWQIEKSFQKYGVMVDSREVSTLARENADRLNTRIGKAKKNLGKINIFARVTFWLGLIYATITFLSTK